MGRIGLVHELLGYLEQEQAFIGKLAGFDFRENLDSV